MTAGADEATRLVVVGQGHVGLPLAMRACEVGFDVVGLDTDGDRIKRLDAGQSVVEDVSDERLASALASGRYHPSTDGTAAAGFAAAVISVPTPLREGRPDLCFIESAAALVAEHVTPGCVVVLESTTYPGTTEELVRPILEAGSGLVAGIDFFLGYSPERIDPGNQEWRFENTPKVVSGINAESLAVVDDFYRRLVDRTVPVSGPKEAELAKLLENTFRHVNIALLNEVAMFAHELDIDTWEAIEAAATKPFGYLRITPGPGVGGHCLPIDPSYLSWRVKDSLGHTFRFVELANDINAHMPDYVVRRLQTGLNQRGLAVQGRQVLLVGLAYKRNTGDARESPARPIARLLTDLGADVRGTDPHVEEDAFGPEVTRVELTEDEVATADAVVLLVDHERFDLDLIMTSATYVLDTRHVLTGPTVDHL